MKRLVNFVLISTLFSCLLLSGYTAVMIWAINDSMHLLDEDVTSNNVAVDEGSLFEIIQRYKQNTVGQRYKSSYYLCGVADERLKEITVDFNHQGLIDKTEQMFKETNFTDLNENIVREVYTDQQAFDSWIASPGHKKTLDLDFTHTCLRCNSTTCVQVFAK